MTEKDAAELLKKWSWAVKQLWRMVCDKAFEGKVEISEAEQKFGNYIVVFKRDGALYLILGRTNMVNGEQRDFETLVVAKDFKLPMLEALVRFVSKTISDARVEVDKLTREREGVLKQGFGFLKQDIAEWNLSSKPGEEV